MQKLSQLTGAIADKTDGIWIYKMLAGIYDRFSSQIFNSGGLAIGTGSKKKVLIANTVYGVAGGVPFTNATAEVTLAGTITNALFNVFCIFVDSAGAETAAMGTEGAALINVKFPPIPTKKAMVGFVIVNPTGTGNFVGATTDLDDGTVVPNAVYVNTLNPFDPTATII
jgi:hypothetical protein